MIACRTTIGFGAPTKAGKASSHGSPLGAEEIAGARKALGWSEAPFEVPADVLDFWRAAGKRGQAAHAAWSQRVQALAADKRAEFERRLAGKLPAGARRRRAVGEADSSPRRRRRSRRRIASERALEAHHRRGAGDDRRLGRPHRLQQHPHQGDEGDVGVRLCRRASSTTACASTAWPRP